MTLPRKLQIGCGRKAREDHVNLDIDPDVGADWVYDLNHPLGLPAKIITDRFGTVELVGGWFEEVLADNVLEHIRDLMTAMRTIYEVMAVGGRFHLFVPHDLSYGAWQDPTHVRAFNEQSWQYFGERCPWPDGYFELAELRLTPSSIGVDLARQGVAHDVIVRTPRAIAEMDVTLVKRLKTA